MKIGLITIYHVPNYGSVLQAFATQVVLEKFGADCKMINYRYPNDWHWEQGTPKTPWIRRTFRKIFPLRKITSLQKFRKQHYNFTRFYNNLSELCNEDWDDYDAFVVGSDQVWNARYVKGDSAFMLSFAPDTKLKFSIASSFAMDSLPEHFHEKYRKYLSKFSVISVREQNGIKILQEDLKLNIPCRVLFDPTMLLSRQEWIQIIPRSNFHKTRPYILFYMLSYAFEPRPYIFKVLKHFTEIMDCDVIALEGYTKPNLAQGVHMKNSCNSSIEEFIDLFANADLVITSSFHGTAFALNFGIPLISIVSEGKGDDRQTTLLKSVGCENNAITVGFDIECIDATYDVAKVQKSLDTIRNENKKWISELIKAN